MGNIKKSAFTTGPCSTKLPAGSPPSGGGQSSGRVKHSRSGDGKENMKHMPK